jgi:hypothetical protein
MVAMFAAIGVGQWSRILTGPARRCRRIGLLIASVTEYAAPLLASIMIGAIIAHATVLGGSLYRQSCCCFFQAVLSGWRETQTFAVKRAP